MARIRRKHRLSAPEMDERRRRQWAAAEARDLGGGGVSLVARAIGLSRPTIHAGMRELDQPPRQRARDAVRIRRPGGGRKRLADADADLRAALEALVDPATRSDPESPRRWTCKSTRRLAEELTRQQHPASPRTVAALLKEAGDSLQGNRTTRAGSSHPDRNAQCEHINAQVIAFHKQRQPVISVDAKKQLLT